MLFYFPASPFIKCCCNSISFKAPGLNLTKLLAHNITQLLPKDNRILKRQNQESKKKNRSINCRLTKQIYLLTELIYRSPKSHSSIPCATPASVSHHLPTAASVGTDTFICFLGQCLSCLGNAFCPTLFPHCKTAGEFAQSSWPGQATPSWQPVVEHFP